MQDGCRSSAVPNHVLLSPNVLHRLLRSCSSLGQPFQFGSLFERGRYLPPRPEIRQRRLTANAGDNPVNSPVISPDGRYLAYSDGGGIRVKLVATGEIQTIAPPATPLSGGDSWTPAAWFPESTRLLTNLVQSGKGSIWKLSIIGGRPRMLRDQGWAWSVSRDGSTIAFAMPGIPGPVK